MFSGCKKAGLAFVLVVSALMMNGCASTNSLYVTPPEEVETNMRDLLEAYADVNEVRQIWVARNNKSEHTISVTPILAAIVLEPKRVQKLINNSAETNYVSGSAVPPLACASHPEGCRDIFGLESKGDYAGESDELFLMKVLLENGGNPDDFMNGVSVKEMMLCSASSLNTPMSLMKINKLKLLSDYGADFSDVEIERCHDQIKSDIDSYSRWEKAHLELGGSMSKEPEEQAKKRLSLVDDIGAYGLKKTLSIWGNQYRIEQERKIKEEAERKRLAAIAREKRRQKMAAIRGYFKQDADLSSALGDVVQSGAYCRTIASMSSTIISGDGEARCSTTVGGEYFSSPNCEAYREQLSRHVADEKRPLCDAYEKQKSSLANLFGKNAGIVKSLIEQDVSNARPIEEIERVYQPEINRLARLRDKDAASERRAMDQASRQRMNNLMNYMQNSFTSTTKADQIIQRSVQNIQQQLYVRANNQKMHEINVNLKLLDKKLDSIDRQVSEKASNPRKQQASQAQQQQQAALQRQQQQRAEAARQWSQQPGVSNQSESFSASSGAASTATKTECVARSESTGPKPNIPKQYCQYVFADYTDNVSFGLGDYSNEFMKESHSKESAKKALGFELLKKAKETCGAKGYSRVHHNETYEYNEVDVNVGQCKENNRMGSIFYLCGGAASFICARSD